MLYDVVIVGGGVIGCAIARELMRSAVRAVLLEKETEVGFGVSKANSGIIHGGHHTAPSTLKGRLEWAGNQMWDALCAELGFGFKRIGELTVAFSAAELEVLRRLKRQGDEKGVPSLEMWDTERIRQAEPNLSAAVIAALHAPTTAVVNPYEACFALIENACRNGLDLFTNSEIQALAYADDAWEVRTTSGAFRGRFVINAAGLNADRIAELAGVRSFSIRPRKGEEYLLDRRLAGIVNRIIFPCPTPVSKGTLVIPTYDGTIMVGPTAESVDDRDDVATTQAGAEAVFAAVKRVVPGISERDCIAEFAGLRAVADTEDFVIGPTARRGFINVAGIQSPGLTAAPAIAVMVCDLLRDAGLVMPPRADFVSSVPRPVRFAALSPSAQADLVAGDPRYSRIACRCEYVTDGEILDAIERGARTLDGIKFRTRAGMGRCQGGFCTWRCMELLHRRLGVPVDAVSKRGGNSWIVCAPANEVAG